MNAPPARRRPWATLWGRIALGAIGGLLVAAVLFVAVGVSLIRGQATTQAKDELDRQARAVAGIVSERAGTALETGQQFSTREPIGNLEELAGPGTRLYYVGLALSPGAADPFGGLPETVARDLDPEVIVRDGSQVFGFTPTGARTPTYGAAAPVLVNGRYLGAIVLTRPQAEVAAAWGGVIVPVVLAVIAGLVVAVGLVLWITHRATRPLRDLEQAARKVAEGDLKAEVAEGGAEELDAVARSFNAMVQQLARRDRMAREFLMRVTHDLRTPLTAIRGHALALSDGVVPEDAVPRSLGAIASEASRLEVLVTDLLDLARMDADRFRVHLARTSAADPVRAAADALSSAADSAGVDLITAIDDLPDITTDADRVQQAIGNLIDNAIRWTPAGGGRNPVGHGRRRRGRDGGGVGHRARHRAGAPRGGVRAVHLGGDAGGAGGIGPGSGDRALAGARAGRRRDGRGGPRRRGALHAGAARGGARGRRQGAPARGGRGLP